MQRGMVKRASHGWKRARPGLGIEEHGIRLWGAPAELLGPPAVLCLRSVAISTPNSFDPPITSSAKNPKLARTGQFFFASQLKCRRQLRNQATVGRMSGASDAAQAMKEIVVLGQLLWRRGNPSPHHEIADYINNDTDRRLDRKPAPVVRTMDCTVYWVRWRGKRRKSGSRKKNC
ncbi:hypothetical protein VTK26DRAFT_257 [Humicola hyalothermophila]